MFNLIPVYNMFTFMYQFFNLYLIYRFYMWYYYYFYPFFVFSYDFIFRKKELKLLEDKKNIDDDFIIIY